jgi:predicted DCC family thiol-disulfide oxidoreductase YuxK
MEKVAAPVTVFYDGLCHLCSREIDHYRTLKGAERIHFLDITSSAFNAAKEGLDPVKVHESMHVRGKDGKLHLGVDAFICIWGELPALRFLVPIAKFLPVHLLLQAFYFAFAKVRPLLPRKQCEDSPYCEIHRKE